jgi:hypothetical protein
MSLLACCGALVVACSKSQPAPDPAPTPAPTAPTAPVADEPSKDVAVVLTADASAPAASDVLVGEDAAVPEADAVAPGVGDDVAAGVDATSPITAGTDSPEAALQLYYEGTREKNADKLWAIMSEPAKKALGGVRNSAIQATDAQLAAAGLEREKLKVMSDREFFVAMVTTTPLPPDVADMKPPTEHRREPSGDDRMKLRFRLGEAFCEADLVKEADGWKVDGTQCEEGG